MYVINITGFPIMQNKDLLLIFDSSIFLQFLSSLPQKHFSAILYVYTCTAIVLGENSCNWFLTSRPTYNLSLSKAIIHTDNSNFSEAQTGTHHSNLLKSSTGS